MIKLFSKFILIVIITLLICDDSYAQASKKKSKEELSIMKARRIEMMIQQLESTNYVAFESSVRAFELMAGDAVSHLIGILVDKDNSDKLHLNTIYTLGRLGSVAKRAVPMITPFLEKENENFKAVSAIALGKIQDVAKPAVSAIVQLLFDESPWVVKSAKEALVRIGTQDALNAIKEFEALQAKIKKSKDASP